SPGRGVLSMLTSSVLILALAIAGCSSKDPVVILSDAKRQLEKGNRAEASIQLKTLLQLDPKHAEARFLLGKVYNESQDGVSAEKELRRALELGRIDGGRV